MIKAPYPSLNLKSYTASKRWDLWRPPVQAPGITIDLEPGQSLLLPRGWVHNPHVTDTGRLSVHLTFAIRERTPLWLAEQLTATIHGPRFRRILLPAQVTGPGLAVQIRESP